MSKKMNSVEIIKQFKKIHGNKYNYDKVDYVDNATKITITCKEHGDFEQRPSNHKLGQGCNLCSNRKLVYGIGVNDADYFTNPIINGKRVECPYYRTWKGILRKCYDTEYHIKRPSYKGCEISKEWHSFMDFRKWMMKQDWVNKELDKDILIPNNKLYSKDTCIFVDSDINKLILDNGASRGKYPIGVSLRKSTGRYKSYIRDNGKKKHLGYFSTPEEASKEYRIAKSKIILDKTSVIKDVRLKKALTNRALELLN